MNDFQAIQIMVACSPESVLYLEAVAFLSDASILSSEAIECLSRVMNLRARDLQRPPLKREWITSIPNLFRCISATPEHRRVTELLFDMAQPKPSRTPEENLSISGKLTQRVTDYFRLFLDVTKSASTDKLPQKLAAASILLKAKYGYKGSLLPASERRDENINTQIKQYLSGDEAYELKLQKGCEELVTTFTWLRQMLNHADRTIRLQARNLCEMFKVPLDLPKLIALNVDGIETENIGSDPLSTFLMVGATGSGKSTLTNYISGVEYVYKKRRNDGVRYLEPKPGQQEPTTVGHSGQSQTLYPQLARIQEGIFACDCPGFNENRSGEEAVCASLGLPLIMRSELPIRIRGIVVVIEWDSTDPTKGGRGKIFRELLHTLSCLVKEPEGLLKGELTGLLFAISKPTEPGRDEVFNPQEVREQLQDRLSSRQKILEMKQDHLMQEEETLKEQLKLLEELDEDISALQAIIHKLERSEKDINYSRFPRLLNWLPGLLNGQEQQTCISRVRSKIDEFKKQYSLLELDVNERRNRIEGERGEAILVKLMSKRMDNVFVIRGHKDNAADEDDDKNRLLSYFEKLCLKNYEIRQEQFVFSAANPEYESTRRWVNDISLTSYYHLKNLLSLPKQLKEKELDIANLQAEIDATKSLMSSVLKESDLASYQSTPKVWESLEEEIKRKTRQLESITAKHQALLAEHEILTANCEALRNDKTEVEYGSELIDDDRYYFLFGIGYFRSTNWHYKFPGKYNRPVNDMNIEEAVIPIQRVQLSCFVNNEWKVVFNSAPEMIYNGRLNKSKTSISQDIGFSVVGGYPAITQVVAEEGPNLTRTGKFVVKKAILEHGKLKIDYVSDKGQHGYAAIRIFVYKRDIPETYYKVKELARKIKEQETLLSVQEEQMNQLENRLRLDTNYLSLLRDTLVGDQRQQVRIERIHDLRKRLGWHDRILEGDKASEFLSQASSSVTEEIELIEWVRKEENFNLLKKISRCRPEWCLKTFQEELRSLCVRFGFEVPTGNFTNDIEADSLYTKLPSDIIKKTNKLLETTKFTLTSWRELLKDLPGAPTNLPENLDKLQKSRIEIEIKLTAEVCYYQVRLLKFKAAIRIASLLSLRQNDTMIKGFCESCYEIEKDSLIRTMLEQGGGQTKAENSNLMVADEDFPSAIVEIADQFPDKLPSPVVPQYELGRRRSFEADQFENIHVSSFRQES